MQAICMKPGANESPQYLLQCWRDAVQETLRAFNSKRARCRMAVPLFSKTRSPSLTSKWHSSTNMQAICMKPGANESPECPLQCWRVVVQEMLRAFNSKRARCRMARPTVQPDRKSQHYFKMAQLHQYASYLHETWCK